MKSDDLNLIEIELGRHSLEPEPSRLAHQLESLVSASRNLESMLSRERTYSKQLREYAQNVIGRVHELQQKEKEQTEKLRELDGRAERNVRIERELEATRSELKRYQDAWSYVLDREKRAQKILARASACDQRILELEGSLATLEAKFVAERDSKVKLEQNLATHRSELQTTLVRLHSSEARYNDMTRELEAVHAIRKSHVAELARAEALVREKLDAEFEVERAALSQAIDREREKLADLALENERARESLRVDLENHHRLESQRVHAEWEFQLARERRRLEEEAALARDQLQEQKDSQIRSLQEHAKELSTALSSARKEIATIELNAERSAEQLALETQNALQDQRIELQALKDSHAREIADKDERISALRSQSAVLIRMVEANHAHLRRMIGQIQNQWGAQDPGLAEILGALVRACETSRAESEPAPAKQGWPAERALIRGKSNMSC